jgi:hypothetical protein
MESMLQTQLGDPAARRARGLAITFAQRGRGECRVPSAPAASCAKWLVQDAHEYSQQSHRKSPGIPARNGFNGFLRALVSARSARMCERAFLSPSLANESVNLTPASRRQDHTTSPSASKTLSSEAPPASIASNPASVTIAIRPSSGVDGCGYKSDLGVRKTRIFFRMGLDDPNHVDPAGEIGFYVQIRGTAESP